MTDVPIEATDAAIRRVGAWLAGRPVPAPAGTWQDFAETFDMIDRAATERLHEELDPVVPGARWFGDEVPASGEGWFVDVTDGAVQYLQGLPHWCVTVAYVVDRQAVATVIHSPSRNETYSATRGAGAFRNGEAIKPSTKTELGVCIAAMNHPPYVSRQPSAISSTGAAMAALLPVVGAVRNFGPTSWQIAETAAGRIDLFWEYGRDEENLLGAALIAAESGLAVTDAGGQPWAADSPSFLAVPEQLSERVLEVLSSL